MNITILSTTDLAHGAGVAAYRLHQSLVQAGENSRMLVSLKVSNDSHVYQIKPNPSSSLSYLKSKLQDKSEKLVNSIAPQCIYSTNNKSVLEHPYVVESDVINLHNLHWDEKNFSLNILPILSKKVPLVWTLHDMWAFTGHCIYSLDCDRWKIGCGKCPDLTSYIPLKIDTTAWLYKIKQQIYQNSQITIVAPSKWLVNLAKQSPLFKDFPVEHIPYGIDQTIYYPLDKKQVRQVLNIDTDAPTIIFVASSLNDTRKGGIYLEQALEKIQHQFKDLQILLLGHGRVCHNNTHLKIIELGYIQSPRIMPLLYSAADLMICPTIADNLPNTVLESLACGTPVVGFNIGGVPDMVEHLENGYIAVTKNADDLATGITTLLNDTAKRKAMEVKAVNTITEKFSFSLQAERYIQLYNSIVQKVK